MDSIKTSPSSQSIIEHASTAFIVIDTSLRIHSLNMAAEMMFSISAARAHEQPLSQLVELPSSVLPRLQVRTEGPQPFTEREIEIRLYNQQKFLIDFTCTPFICQAGEQWLLLELNRVDRLIRIAREEALIAQHETSRNLLRGLAHEIKNPLGGLRGAAQLLERELVDEDLKEYTQIIISEADRLQNLINRMLGPNTRPNFTAINIHEVLEHVRQLLAAEACDTVKLETDYDPSIPLLVADKDWLIQAILNVAGNALQAITEHGTIRFMTRVIYNQTIGTVTHRLALQINIIDNGSGIPSEIADSLFFPMVTGRHSGTGLGLSIAQSLINQHHGMIECKSKPGNTHFSIILPMEQQHDD